MLATVSQWFAITSPDLVAACLMLVAAFAVRDQRLLRFLAQVSGVLVFVWAARVDQPVVVFFAGLFILVNGLRLVATILGARRGMMTAEERSLIAEVLAIEEPAKQRRLRDVITWRDADTGEVLMRQGQVAPPLIYVATGQIAVEHEGLPVGTCGPDDFLGEMSLVTGQGASATVKVALPARIAVFDRDALVRLMDAMPELARAFDRRLNQGLADKIRRMNRASSGAGAQG